MRKVPFKEIDVGQKFYDGRLWWIKSHKTGGTLMLGVYGVHKHVQLEKEVWVKK